MEGTVQTPKPQCGPGKSFSREETDPTKILPFLQSKFVPKPRIRLNPRSALRGGKVEVYALRWRLRDHNSERLFFYDVNVIYFHYNIFSFAKKF